jgi:hypothetical protein
MIIGFSNRAAASRVLDIVIPPIYMVGGVIFYSASERAISTTALKVKESKSKGINTLFSYPQ